MQSYTVAATCAFVVLLACTVSAAVASGILLPGGSGSAAAGAPCSAKLLAARGRLRIGIILWLRATMHNSNNCKRYNKL
jgi:hypothetical protein